MSNVYDRVLRENVGELILPFASRNFGLNIATFEPLPDKVPLTRDREVDFAAKVKTVEGKEMILHVEFQATNDPNFHLRMLDYHTSLILKYRMEIFHGVMYIGRKRPTFRTRLEDHEIMREFVMVDIGRTPTEQYLESESPEEVILGILADFEEKKPEEVIRALTKRIVEVCKGEKRPEKFLQQLRIISQIRNLEPEVSKEIENMPLNIDIRRDPWYQRGEKRGEKRGELKAQERIALRMLKDGLGTEAQIASATGLSLEKIGELKKRIQN